MKRFEIIVQLCGLLLWLFFLALAFFTDYLELYLSPWLASLPHLPPEWADRISEIAFITVVFAAPIIAYEYGYSKGKKSGKS